MILSVRHRNIKEGNISIGIRETYLDGWRWIELAQERFQWRVSVLVALNLQVQPPGCEHGSWMELAQDRVKWQALVLVVLNLRVLLPELVD
jgi:hypothetical protein